jgi:hypothetical protein
MAQRGAFDESAGKIKSMEQVLLMHSDRMRNGIRGQRETVGVADPLRSDC